MTIAALRVRPVGAVHGSARVPSSKSILNRALICAASADAPTELLVEDPAEDGVVLRDALRAAGVPIACAEGTWTVDPRGRRMPAAETAIDLGEAGTAARFLPPWLACGRGVYRLDGRGRLRERPHRPLAHALIELGARLETAAGGALPWTLHAQGLRGAALRVSASTSSQFLSGLLLAGPSLESGALELLAVGETRSAPYLELTREVMRDFGVEVERDGAVLRVREGARFRSPRVYAIEADASGAAFFFVAAALTGGDVHVAGLHARSAQGDTAALEHLRALGADAGFDERGAFVRGKATRGFDLDFADRPDLAPPFAVLAASLPERSKLRGVASLRAKESDRLAALACELEKAGAVCRATEDELEIEGPIRRGARFATHGDHRLAMAFALLGLVQDGVEVEEPRCVAKSFPGFFAQLRAIAPGCVD